MERALRQRFQALPPVARAELVHVLRLSDLDRAERIGEFWANPETRTLRELLIDPEEDRYANRPRQSHWKKTGGQAVMVPWPVATPGGTCEASVVVCRAAAMRTPSDVLRASTARPISIRRKAPRTPRMVACPRSLYGGVCLSMLTMRSLDAQDALAASTPSRKPPPTPRPHGVGQGRRDTEGGAGSMALCIVVRRVSAYVRETRRITALHQAAFSQVSDNPGVLTSTFVADS